MIPLLRLFIAAALLLLASCTNKPVRHLASDATLIKPGTSKEDVLTYLGDPDAQQMASETTEKWVYYEERQSGLRKTPYLGRFFKSRGYSQITVTIEGERVVDVTYSSHETDEFDWADDYPWQEKRE